MKINIEAMININYYTSLIAMRMINVSQFIYIAIL